MVVYADVQFLMVCSFDGEGIESSFLETPKLIMEGVVLDSKDNVVSFFYFLLVEAYH